MNTEKTPYQTQIDVLVQETEAKFKDLHAKFPFEQELKPEFLFEDDKEEEETMGKIENFITAIADAKRANSSSQLAEVNINLKFFQNNTPDFGALFGQK